MQNTVGELLNIINFVLFSYEKTKIRVRFSESFKFWCNRGDVKFILQFSTAIFESFVMKEDDIRFWELLSRLLRDADVDVLMKGGVDESNIVVADDLDKFFPCAGELLRWPIVTLEPDLDSVVIFVEFDFRLTHVS